ncbi:MAG: hypothetical protein JRJ84_14710 [Deltaproteobacteria bacterium]|nr:hypothetical protein [Deltaproteobacteria bacterium]
MSVTHPLPDLYARWMADVLPDEMPSEPGATCDDCAMCVKADGEMPTSVYFFDPEVKCCVYMPRLPNFLVGRVLADDRPEGEAGRGSAEARIRAGVGVTPLGLDRPPRYDLLFRNSANTIGRSRELRCPHYLEEGGRCGIWRHRDALCSTWFCRHQRGQVGAALWAALRDLLAMVEVELARWAALQEGVHAEVLYPFLPRSEHDRRLEESPDGLAIDGIADETVRRALWGERVGDEGTEVAVRAAVGRERYATWAAPSIPERLRVGRFEVAATRAGGCRVVTHSSLDALDLPSQLVALLPLFDGRRTDEVLRQLEESHQVQIDSQFLQELVDWGVLVSVEG